jgi:hypothetical protein
MEEHNIFDMVTCPCERADPVTFTAMIGTYFWWPRWRKHPEY